MKSCCKDVLEPEQEPEAAPPAKSRMRIWLKRIGIAGFLFFLIKGLFWLAFGSAILAHFTGCK